jgi:hypothetical protein
LFGHRLHDLVLPGAAAEENQLPLQEQIGLSRSDEVFSTWDMPVSLVEVPFNVSETTATNRQLPHTTAASVLLDEGPLSAVVGPKIATTIVSRGDSL